MSKQSIPLSELAQQMKAQMKIAFDRPIWVRAEISELHENASGHAYLELVEKDAESKQIVAKLKANCWANTYRMLKAYFENATGQSFRSGITILFACSVEFHEVYGISLTLRDIDPSFTMGEMAMQRLKIIRRLQEDGVMEMNRELELSATPQRIAIISSATAAGYGDFIDQLNKNTHGFIFYTKLFPAIMQGEQTADSIISALDKIAEHSHLFDVVVIIRGGGATAELSSFDNYELAFNCAQFPLPILTGIGHERDESILDMIAHTRAKTPTAAAEFLISTINFAYDSVIRCEDEIIYLSNVSIRAQKNHLQQLQLKLQNSARQSTFYQKQKLNIISEKIKQRSKQQIVSQKHLLDLLEIKVQQSSPDEILKKGYTLTLKNGKIIKKASQIKEDDTIISMFYDGKAESVVKNINFKS